MIISYTSRAPDVSQTRRHIKALKCLDFFSLIRCSNYNIVHAVKYEENIHFSSLSISYTTCLCCLLLGLLRTTPLVQLLLHIAVFLKVGGTAHLWALERIRETVAASSKIRGS